MKKINFTKLLIALILTIGLFSCSSDSGGESNGTTTGNYWPMAVQNEWNFDANGTTEQLKMIGSTSFGGITYYELHDDGDDSTIPIQNWVTKKGATYYQKIADIHTIQSGVSLSIEGYEAPVFKDDLEVNQTWSGTLYPKISYTYMGTSGTLPSTVSYTGKILAKNVSETVNGLNYNDIIKSSLTIQTTVDGEVTTVNLEYWFAKDIGPIYEYEQISGQTATLRTLETYTLH